MEYLDRELSRLVSKALWQYVLAIVEPLYLLGIIVAFWHHSPPIRDEWVWLLWGALPIFWLRLRVHGRLWTRTPLNDLFLLFILLTAFNFGNAPYRRQDYLVVLVRPLMGMWLYVYFVEHARNLRRMHLLLIGSIGMSFVLGFLALTTTQWPENKAQMLLVITEALPRINYHQFLPDMLLSFNPNEIAGALAWVCPFLFGIFVSHFTTDANSKTVETEHDSLWLGIRIAASITFGLVFLALFLSQSRFAIAGVILALAIIIYLHIPQRRWRYGLFFALGMMTLLQASFVLNLFPSPANDTGLSTRDQRSLSTRLQIWERGWRMMWDFPATGVGMAMYRAAVRADNYVIPHYERTGQIPPHAHNEWLQIGADLGVGGLLLFLAWQGVAAYMLWHGWNSHDTHLSISALSIATGLMAHGFYAIGDAITLWDRYAFIFWWMLGLVGAQYIISQCKAVR